MQGYDELLKFAESIANHRSANLHGFHSDVVRAARAAVKAADGHLGAIGRYREGEVDPMSWSDYAKVKHQREQERKK